VFVPPPPRVRPWPHCAVGANPRPPAHSLHRERGLGRGPETCLQAGSDYLQGEGRNRIAIYFRNTNHMLTSADNLRPYYFGLSLLYVGYPIYLLVLELLIAIYFRDTNQNLRSAGNL